MPQTNSTPEGASVDRGNAVDQIAEMFIDEKDTRDQADSSIEDELEEEDTGEDEESEINGDEEEELDEEEQEVTWADALGVDNSKLVLDDEGNFKAVKVKIDGEESTVDMPTLIAGYQTAKSTTQKSQALAEERRQLEAQSAMMVNTFRSKMEEAENFVGLLHKKMLSDFEGIDLRELRVKNPAEYAAILADKQAREADLANMIQHIRLNKQAAEQVEQQQREEQMRRFYAEQADRALGMFPDWRDQEKAQRDFSEMNSFLREYGFSDEEFAQIADPRILAVLRTVIDTQTARKESEKKVVKAKTKVRSSTRNRRAKSMTKLDRLVKRAKSAQGSHKRVAQTDAIAELLLNE